MTAGRVLSEEELSALLDDALNSGWAGLNRRPLPAVLDTDFIRTGLHHQLSKGIPPRSVQTAREGALRLFMEHDTLAETGQKLPKFAAQLGVPVAKLRRILNEDWLPHVDVVKLPDSLRQADPRAMQVRDRDAADFPAAALAALLSPCLLLTRNYKHFGVLGIRTHTQSVDGVMAVVAIRIGEMHVQAVVMLPALPVRVAGATMGWATDRIGPAAWVILGVLVAGGVYWYFQQPPERRDRINEAAGQIGSHLLTEFGKAAGGVQQARLQLRACMVPRPGQRSSVSAIVRELALSPESLSAQQLSELLTPGVRLPVADLRAFLRRHDGTVFAQARRGGFVLGSHYQLPG
jgi:hypothetical protein